MDAVSDEAVEHARKDAFHIAKLSLFNVRLLRELEDARAGAESVAAVVLRITRTNKIREPISLMNQATFLSHAYVCLVWLPESLMNINRATSLVPGGSASDFFQSLTFKGSLSDLVEVIEQVPSPGAVGARDLSTARSIVTTVRNAISHGRVTFDSEDRWLLTDTKQPNDPSKERIVLRMTSVHLGRLCDEVLFAVNSNIYGVPRE